MSTTAEVTRTHRNMTEKLGWAARSCSRIDDAKTVKDAESVQDHFWSFLHGSRLIWFYLGEFLKNRGDPKETAARIMNGWVGTNLSIGEQKIWKAVAELRTEDVHTKPVETEEKQTVAIASRGGKILARNGKICSVKVVKYVVQFDGDEYDAVTLANQGIKLLQRFVTDFPTLV